MDNWMNGFGLVVLILAIYAVFKIINSSLTGKPLNKEIERQITNPVALYITGAFAFGSGYGIYMMITDELDFDFSFACVVAVAFVISSTLFLAGFARLFKRKPRDRY